MKSFVNNAIDALYRDFLSVPRPKSIVGCEHCLSLKQRKALLKAPLREILSHNLAPYASSVTLTVGSSQDLRYFLPRILEISFLDVDWWPTIEVTTQAIFRSDFNKWSDEERCSVIFFYRSVLDYMIFENSNSRSLSGWLLSFGLLEQNLTPILENLIGNQALFLEFYEENVDAAKENRLINPFFEEYVQAAEPIIQWILSVRIESLAKKFIDIQYGIRK